MSNSCESASVQLCGCCEGVGRETPAPIYNRPALAQIVYRAGVFATFKASMIAALSNREYGALSALTTRDDGDFSIALIDAWALVSDIITFYQERAANEAYLRTATVTRSVFELARLVGYQPSPGVAASAPLAFTLNDAPGAPDPVVIASGSRVQSTPGAGQSPQTFETSADLTAYVAHNALAATTTGPVDLTALIGNSAAALASAAVSGASVASAADQDDPAIWLAGTSTGLKVGDGVLFIADDDCVQNADSPNWSFCHVVGMSVDSARQRTQISLDTPLAAALASATSVTLYAMRKRAALYGYNAPDPKLLADQTLAHFPSGTFTPAGSPATPTIADWNFASTLSGTTITLDQVYQGIVSSGSPANPTWIVLVADGGPSQFYQVTGVAEGAFDLYAISSKATQVTLHAPDGTKAKQTLAQFVTPTPRMTVAFVQNESLTVADQPVTQTSIDNGTASGGSAGTPQTLQAGMLTPIFGDSVEVGGGQRLTAGRAVAISGKRLRITVIQAGAYLMPADGQAPILLNAGDTFILDSYPPVQVAVPPALQWLSSALANLTSLYAWSVITTTGQPGMLYVDPSQTVLVPPDKNDPSASEAAVLDSLDKNGTSTTLVFTAPLARIYDRETFAVNANVVEASNGQTVNELLGNGDGTQAGQTFTLKQSPLTYVSTSNGEGGQSTLEIWVNELQWHEVASLLDQSNRARVFVTRMAQDGTVTVQFGDGVHGARLPSGQMNVRAVYRKGIGTAGNVPSGQLNQPLDRPAGLKSASNPASASGGADPATLADARTSAPLLVQTIGRVVSLEDYENYALAFSGIAKALATWTWFGRTRGVFVTAAGADGDVLDPAGTTLANLVAAYRRYGSPYVPIRAMSYQPRWFRLGGNVKVDAWNYDPPTVLAAVRDALTLAFGFDARALGEGVAASLIVKVAMQVPGVQAVRLTVFNRDDQGVSPGAPLLNFLPAFSPVPGDRQAIVPAELMLLDTSSLKGLQPWS
ncbi:baseplate J/gp47 family protein [Paraburkholderia sp. UCT2]|uniref:baseplate J/gp47 family protein n=1 Tax=Paraburkholderia sp. UCT2 TaxID=2615208 RepID=UPI00165672E0|nr:baseplate J/gp47 family protein [Paraburkholderia sp. UCT2]MBC8730286.1 hypothetical protein [Paraburkholderia sp. UCT2]